MFWTKKRMIAMGVTALSLGTPLAFADVNSLKPCVSPHGPCFLHGEASATDGLELFAKANCRCVDGSCKEITCTTTVGASLEDAKNQLRAELTVKAQRLNGQIVGEINFELRKR